MRDNNRSRIFISYRRHDTAADMTDRIYERLAQRWRRRVFVDIEGIAGGDVFGKTIEETLQNCAVVIVVIGRDWLSLRNEQGMRRIDDAGDYPRMEVAAALRRGIRVIPLLVGNVAIPRREELPSDISGLLDRQFVRITRERFDADMQRLIAAVDDELPIEPWRAVPWRGVAVSVLLMAVVGAAYVWVSNQPSQHAGVDTPGVGRLDDSAPKELPDRATAKGNSDADIASADPLRRDPGGQYSPDVTQTSQSGVSQSSSASRSENSNQRKAAARQDRSVNDSPKEQPAERHGQATQAGSIDVSGKWLTNVVTNPYDNTDRYRLMFNFIQQDGAWIGTVTTTSIAADQKESSHTRRIVDGKIKNDLLSFYTEGAVWSNGKETAYKESYTGVLDVKKNTIALERLNDVPGGGHLERFVGMRN